MVEINIVISKYKLEARISIDCNETTFPSKEEILKALKKEGVIYGINNDTLDSIISKKIPVSYLLIAKGLMPQRGESAELIWQIEIDYSKKPTITDTNRADFKKLKLFERVQKDQTLVSILPPTKGTPGKNVFGEEFYEEGQDIGLPLGKNTIISEDGLTLQSAIDGYAYWENDLLCIDNVYEIKGNVDYHTGNIRANGTVLIEGDVRSGFRVEATESIIIKGNVEAASIYSQSGDITIECGILGNERAKILAGGNLTCGFIQDATVSVKGTINVEHYVINSKMSSGGNVKVDKNEGLIRGGIISSGTGIHALEVGSEQKIYTELNIRLGDSIRDTSLSWNIGKKQRELESKISKYEKRVSFLQLLQQRVEDLSVEKNEELTRLMKNIENVVQEIETLKQKDSKIRQVASEDIKRNEILIEKKLYKNVSIDFGGIEYFSEDKRENIKIFREEDEIVFERLS